MVADLKQILTDLNVQQLEASANHNQALSRSISQSFTEGLREPMDRISQAVTRVGSSQGEAVNQLLTDVLANFSTQMNEMFGSQFQGMNEMLHQSTLAMQSTISRFDQLAANMQTAGQGAADAMAEKLSDAIKSMEARQSAASQQMAVFLEQMRTVSKDSQTETSQKMQTILGELGEKVSTMVSQLELQADKAAGSHASHLTHLSETMIESVNMMKTLMMESQSETLSISKRAEEDHSKRQDEFSNQTATLITDLSNQVGTLSDRVGSAAEAMRSSIANLTQASRDSIDRFAAGAETLYVASSDFAKAGQGVATTMQSAAQATEKMQSVAVLLSGAAASVQNVMDDYKKTRETFAAIVANLESTISNASREASFTSEIISQIRQATELLTVAQSETEDYLKNVTDVLATAHENFASSVTKTLRKGNADFQQELTTAVGLLKGGIQDFGDALDSFSTKRS